LLNRIKSIKTYISEHKGFLSQTSGMRVFLSPIAIKKEKKNQRFLLGWLNNAKKRTFIKNTRFCQI
jgi:hypothetical protein